ncbi:MAG: aldehyde dehydrogenase family protein, partial [bacterium]
MKPTAEKKAHIAHLLETLRITEVNAGACSGSDEWIFDEQGCDLVSADPSTGEPLATVRQASAQTYDSLSERARESFLHWRTMPAPQRGLVIRDLGNGLRRIKEPLGELIAVEMGKIRAEGLGE